MPKYAILSETIHSENGWFKGYLVIEDGIIRELSETLPPDVDAVIDHSKHTIIPGLIDTHVHVNEPGRTHWEGFETASKAAASGGFTTIIDMPLNSSPVTVSLDNLKHKIKEMTSQLYCQVGFHGGIVPESIGEIEVLQGSGIFGLKIFTIHSGIDEFGHIVQTELEDVMTRVATVNGTLMVHAELESTVPLKGNPRDYTTYLQSRPRSWENKAIALLIELMRRTGCRVHIIHLSSSDALHSIKSAKDEGLPLTVETCPHYLYFASENIEHGRTEFKCAPPIRELENQQNLWKGIKEGTIDFISSDHSPSPPELKERKSGDFMKAWGGISSLQFSFLAVNTQAKQYEVPLRKVIALMSTQPAQFLGLEKKGLLKPGFDADIVILDSSKDYIVEVGNIHHKHPLTPYLGHTLSGEIVSTYVAGKEIYSKQTGEFNLVENPLIFKKKL